MLYKWIIIVMMLLITKTCQSNGTVNNSDSRISWIQQMKYFRTAVNNCLMTNESTQQGYNNNKTTSITWGNCLKSTTLKIFDDIMSSNVITLMDGVKLVRISSFNQNINVATTNQSTEGNKLIEKTREHSTTSTSNFNLIQRNSNETNNNNRRRYYSTTNTSGNSSSSSSSSSSKSSRITDIWYKQIWNRIMKTLSTHVLQINIMDLQHTERVGITSRHRRHRNHMMMAMMFGVTAMGAIIVPVGFQLLSMISGKALLLAKMALLLASINGLKKIASSGIHYGLYHVPEHYVGPAAGAGYYDRTENNHQNLLQQHTIPQFLNNRFQA